MTTGPRDQAWSKEPSSDSVGARGLAPLGDNMAMLGDRLSKDEALGLILVDATPLLEIERLYGAQPFRRTLDALIERLQSRVYQEIGEDFLMTSGALAEEHILIFLPRNRGDREFFTQELPLLTDDLRAYFSLCFKGIVYPYLYHPPEAAVGFGICFYRPFHRIENQIRRLIESTLRTAHFELERVSRVRGATLERILLEEDLATVYEPIVKLPDRKIIGYEALARGPIGSGLENPMALFAVAERNELEYEIDTLCRRQALRNAAGLAPYQKLFLNILPSSLHDPEFAGSRVRETLGGLGLSPQNLVLEVSERQAISNYPIFREAIDHFSSLGFEIALDDTGAGFASLEAALELNPQYLKIDMSLVRGIEGNPQKQEVLRGLQKLAEKMNATVIAEGIETESEFETIRGLGIACGQGFLFGRGGPILRTGVPSSPKEDSGD